jgi:hypothetical protein
MKPPVPQLSRKKVVFFVFFFIFVLRFFAPGVRFGHVGRFAKDSQLEARGTLVDMKHFKLL